MGKRRKFNVGKTVEKLDVRFIFIIAVLIVMVMAFMYLGVDFGFNVSSANDYLAVLPYLFFFIIGLYIIVSIGGIYMLPAFGILGFGIAGLLREMWVRGMITPEMMTGLSIDQIMFWTVIIALIFGGILTAITSKRKK
jgi:hypothetical protein